MDEKTTDPAEIVIIGAGPGGYAAAFLAADLGLDVTLIDPNKNPGGVCLYRGCIPSKALLNASRLIREADAAGEMGIAFTKPKIDIHKLRSWKNGVVTKLTDGLGRLGNQRKIDYIRGKAKFKGNHILDVHTVENGTRELSFQHAVIATGSQSAELSGVDHGSPYILDSEAALELEDIPKKLLIVGGGYIGLELGTVYASLGSKITLVEITSGLLPGVDRDLVRVLRKPLDRLFETIALNTSVQDLKILKNGIKATLKGLDAEATQKRFDKVLVAVGRRPDTKDLGLEVAGISVNSKGIIKVDSQCRTTADNIFAIGDVAGEPMLAHKASHQGRVAIEVIAGRKSAFEPIAIPAVVFTDPEIAWAGLTEARAKEMGIEFQTVRFPWAASGRAMTIGRTDGLTKLLLEKQTERVIGVGIVGPHAGEMIAEGVLAIEMAANTTDLKLTVHPHPTLTETVQEAAELFSGTATHYFSPNKAGHRNP
jgi:dihydrolipoamide dehydrogenase